MSNDLTIYDLNIQYEVPEDETKAPANIANVTLYEIVELTKRLNFLTDRVMGGIGSVERMGFEKSKATLGDIKMIEEDVVEFMMTHKFLNGFLNKVKKQIEHFYSPFLTLLKTSEYEIKVPATNGLEIGFKQKTDTKQRFNYNLTAEMLKANLNLNSDIDYKKYIDYLENDAGFNIARTNLEKTLKKNGFLEEDILKSIGEFVTTEIGSQIKIVLPDTPTFDINKRFIYVIDDAFVSYNNGTKGANIKDLLKTYLYLSAAIESEGTGSKYYYAKIERTLKDEDNIGEVNYALEYISIKQEEVIKVKFNGLFKDKNGNFVDIIEYLKDYFHLSGEDVNNFVNSRKRNSISLPSYVVQNIKDGNTSIPIYEVEETKFSID